MTSRLARATAPILTVAAIALAGASPTAAATPEVAAGRPAEPVIAGSWCLTDWAWETCFEVSGSAIPADASGNVNEVQETVHAVVRVNGVTVGETTETASAPLNFGADGTAGQELVAQVGAVYLVETCSLQLTWRRDATGLVLADGAGRCR